MTVKSCKYPKKELVSFYDLAIVWLYPWFEEMEVTKGLLKCELSLEIATQLCHDRMGLEMQILMSLERLLGSF